MIKKTTLTIIAFLGMMDATTAVELQQASVDMSNPAYLSSMTLSDWKLFSANERLKMFKQSELDVNASNAKITKQEVDNAVAKEALKKNQLALIEATNNVKKQGVELKMVAEEQKSAAEQKQSMKDMMK